VRANHAGLRRTRPAAPLPSSCHPEEAESFAGRRLPTKDLFTQEADDLKGRDFSRAACCPPPCHSEPSAAALARLRTSEESAFLHGGSTRPLPSWNDSPPGFQRLRRLMEPTTTQPPEGRHSLAPDVSPGWAGDSTHAPTGRNVNPPLHSQRTR
jgi:hypothetical protein